MEDVNIGRRVAMFRCHIDPHIPPKPRNAFVMGDGPDQLPGEAIWMGTYIQINAKTKEGIVEYGVSMGQLEMWRFEPREKTEAKKVKAG